MRTQEFYPSKANGAFASPESSYSDESRAVGDPDGDEDNTGYEAEDGTVEDCKMPSYKAIVLAKKSEFKNQYGKGYFLKPRECGGKPARIAYSPNIKIGPVYLFGKKVNDGNVAEYDRATARFGADMAKWHECRGNANTIGWVPGWRAKWNEFKRGGGLDVLKQQANCELPAQTQLTTGNTQPSPAAQMVANMSCQQLKDTFGIVPGQSWGTAIPEAIKLWQQKQCFVQQAAASTGVAHVPGEGPNDETTPTGLVNKIINNKGIAITLGAIIVIILITTVILIPTKKAA